MGQTFFTTGEPGSSKRLKIQSDVSKVDLHDETVIRWRRSVFKTPGEGEKVRIAAFDLDETLITTKSGTPFAKHGHDWRLLKHMTMHLEALTRDEKCRTIVVVFTNQGGVIPRQDAKSYVNLMTKIGGVVDALPILSLVYAAAKAATPEKRAQYRKPGRGMFELLKQDLKPGIIDMKSSFYVGDAAGRHGDHSPDDKNFAKAAGLRFYTPEQWLESELVVKSPAAGSSASDQLDGSSSQVSSKEVSDVQSQGEQSAKESRLPNKRVTSQQPTNEEPRCDGDANNKIQQTQQTQQTQRSNESTNSTVPGTSSV